MWELVYDICIALLLLVTTYVGLSTRRLLFNDIYNNTKNKMYEVLYKETDLLSGTTACERALMCHLANKLSIIYRTYLEVKKSDIGIINNEQLKVILLADGKLELSMLYPFFPEEFLNKINTLNENSFKEFKDNMNNSILTSNKKSDILHFLKTNTISSFRKNIKMIVRLFMDTRHLIQDKEYQDIYPEIFTNSKAIIEEHTKTEYLEFHNKVSLDKTKIKELITLGVAGLDQALYFLNIFTKDNYEKNKEVIMMLARLSEFNKKERMGLENPNSELAIITKNTLEILNTL